MSASDMQFASHRDNPYHERDVRDANRFQVACEAVADRLFLSRSPEFVAFLQSRVSDQDVAEMVVALTSGWPGVARNVAKGIRGEWTSYVCAGPHELRNEINREL